MNILYLSADRGIPVRGTKGAAVHVRSLCAAFDQLGHRVTLMTPRPGPVPGQTVKANLIDVPLPVAESAPEAQSAAYADTLFAAAKAEAGSGRYDFIYERYSLWSDVGARLREATGLPFVLEVNAPLLEEAARYRSLEDAAKAAEIEHRQMTGASTVAVVSEPLASYVRMRGAATKNVIVIPNAVDPGQFHPGVRGGRIHHRYGLNGRKIVGFAGRARPWHDIDTLLQAFALLQAGDRAMHLLLVGDMPEELPDRLIDLDIAGAVTTTGAVPHAEVPAHIAAMNVAVSSHAAVDGFYFSPLKLYEYMACGVPVVAADLGQQGERIAHGVNGLLYRPGDPTDLAAQVRRLLQKPEYANTLAWNGAVQVLENHTWTRNARAVIERVRPAPLGPPFSTNGHALELPILDAKLRQRLYRATRPDLAARLLRRKGPERKKYARLKQIEILKYKPGRRCVLRYTWEKGSTGEVKLIGKVFRDGRGEKLDAVHRILWHAGLNAGPVRIPKPYGYAAKMRMQLQENAPGTTLNDLYRLGAITHLVPLCALGAARLHGTGAQITADQQAEMRRLIGTYGLVNELDSLADTYATLCELRPADSAAFAGIYGRLQAWAAALQPAYESALVHRDFYYSQVLIRADHLVIIDLDMLADGDAAIDIANFSAHLHFLGLETHGDFFDLAEEAASFKSHYQALRPQGTDFWGRVRFYEAATLFRLLRVVALRPKKAHVLGPLLHETLACLEVV